MLSFIIVDAGNDYFTSVPIIFFFKLPRQGEEEYLPQLEESIYNFMAEKGPYIEPILLL